MQFALQAAAALEKLIYVLTAVYMMITWPVQTIDKAATAGRTAIRCFSGQLLQQKLAMVFILLAILAAPYQAAVYQATTITAELQGHFRHQKRKMLTYFHQAFKALGSLLLNKAQVALAGIIFSVMLLMYVGAIFLVLLSGFLIFGILPVSHIPVW